jgi:hypothetical protein
MGSSGAHRGLPRLASQVEAAGAGAGCNAMSDRDALGADMHRLLGLLEAGSPAADQDILERLLDGGLDPASAPSDYRRLARLLAAVAVPAAPQELAMSGG